MTKEEWAELYRIDREEKEAILKEHPELAGDGDFWDSHSCRRFADESGCCQWCGALVYGSPAYCDAYGCDPPERPHRRSDDWEY